MHIGSCTVVVCGHDVVSCKSILTVGVQLDIIVCDMPSSLACAMVGDAMTPNSDFTT